MWEMRPTRHLTFSGLVLLLMTGILFSGLPSPSHAQISPGPLSTSHANLEGVTNCLKCHEVGKSHVESKCLECHKEVAFLREGSRGFHARGAAGQCGDCHPEHGGQDFEIIAWPAGGQKQFDHSQAGWKLDGKHASLQCDQCHTPRFHEEKTAQLRPGGLRKDSWMGLPTECTACHKDVHDGRFGVDCRTCHQTIGWKELRENAFDHKQTRYPLLGLHASTACAACHKNGYEKLPQFTECRSCHADRHQGQATINAQDQDCAACHTVNGFLPSTFDIARHEQSQYPLAGRHRQVACRNCHGTREATFRFRLQSGRCSDCHADAHAGQFKKRPDAGACSACHDVQGFQKSSFTVADHENLKFPLWGAHSAVSCQGCHARAQSSDSRKSLGAAAIAFRFNSFDCVVCHVEPHGETLGRQDEHCLQCHNASRFVPSQVDAAMHAQFKYALGGSHLAVGCADCHADLKKAKPNTTLLSSAASWPLLSFKVANQNCEGCHADPHAGQFEAREAGGACALCHTTEVFRPARGFDHSRDSAFSLEGAHAKVACKACHPRKTLQGGVEGTLYRPTPNRCEDCHALGTVGEKP